MIIPISRSLYTRRPILTRSLYFPESSLSATHWRSARGRSRIDAIRIVLLAHRTPLYSILFHRKAIRQQNTRVRLMSTGMTLYERRSQAFWNELSRSEMIRRKMPRMMMRQMWCSLKTVQEHMNMRGKSFRNLFSSRFQVSDLF